MPVTQPFAGVSQEETLALIALTLVEIKEKLPRVDANDRMVMNNSEVTSTVNIGGGQTLATVTTLATLNNIGQMNGYNNGSYIAPHIANAGCQHIYDNIRFT